MWHRLPDEECPICGEESIGFTTHDNGRVEAECTNCDKRFGIVGDSTPDKSAEEVVREYLENRYS